MGLLLTDIFLKGYVNTFLSLSESVLELGQVGVLGEIEKNKENIGEALILLILSIKPGVKY